MVAPRQGHGDTREPGPSCPTPRLHGSTPVARDEEYAPRMAAQLAKARVDIGIVTGRIGASLAFYRDLLGFEPVLVVPRETGDIHVLMAGETLLKIWDVPVAAPGTPGAIGAVTGLRYLSIWVTNQDELLTDLEAAGVDVLGEPHEVAAGTVAALVADPDGNVVEVLQESG